MLAAALALALGYAGGVYLGFALTFDVKPVSTLWPPNAILLAALLLTRSSAWWLLIVAVLPAHVLAELSLGVPPAMAGSWFVSNTVEALLGATLIRRYLGGAPRLDRMRDVSAFVLVAGALSPVLTSFLDVAFVATVGWRYSDFWQIWSTRTLSNALAALTVTPILIIGIRRGMQLLRPQSAAERAETLVLFAGLCITSAIVFQQKHPPQLALVLLNAPLPFLIWAAVRRGVGGASLGVAIVATSAILGVLNGRGPFMAATPEATARAMQVFLIIAACSLLLLAASQAELRRARAISQWQAENLKLALRAARMGTWEWDIARDQLSWRAREVRTISSRARPPARTFEDVMRSVHPDDREALAHAVRHAVECGGNAEVEFRALRANGSVRWISMRGTVMFDPRGKPARMIGVYSDTTLHRAQEAQLSAQREQIARLYRFSLLGELSAALAHEVKQPLTAILSNAQAAQAALTTPQPDLALIDDILTDIIAENRRTTEIIRRLRSLFVRGTLQAHPVDANECIREVVDLERSYLIAHRVTVSMQLGAGLPAVMIDRVQLQQVLINLITNACEAMSQRPRGERHIGITSVARDGHVCIEIRDTGTGLADPEAIFTPFFTTKPDSLGLGLAICRTLITAHEGRLWASNNASSGATLHICLPAADVRKDDIEGGTREQAAQIVDGWPIPRSSHSRAPIQSFLGVSEAGTSSRSHQA